MRLTVKLAVVVVTLAVAASTAGASVNAPKERSANNLTVWLQVDAQSGWPEAVARRNRAVQGGASRLERHRAVPELARPSAEVRRDTRGEHCSRRHRDG